MKEFKHPCEYFKRNIVFETPRLILRRIETYDAEDMYDYASRELTTRYLLWSPHNGEYATRYVIESIRRDYRMGKYYELAVILRENGRMIGTCGITTVDEANRMIEVGYVINPDYWGMGIAAEAASVMINFAFCELNANRVEAKYIKGNENSKRVMEKCGMVFEGIHRGKMLIKGHYRDIGICAILADEYFDIPRENLYRQFNKTGIFDSIFGRIK